MDYFNKVKQYVLDLEYTIVNEDPKDGTIVIEREDDGIKNMILVIDDPIVIIEQPLIQLNNPTTDTLKKILIKNRDILSGALALDESDTLIFHDTLQLENLDLNELAASIESLSLLLTEWSDEIINLKS